MTKFKNPAAWFYSLFSGAIGGGATAVLSSLGLAGAASVGIEVKPLDLEQMSAVFVSGAAISVIMYLKQSPLPPVEEEQPKEKP